MNYQKLTYVELKIQLHNFFLKYFLMGYVVKIVN